MLQKSLTLTVDTIAYDLEDSVTSAQKPAARKHIRHILSQPRAPGVRENAVRINSVASGLALDDLREIVCSISFHFFFFLFYFPSVPHLPSFALS